MRTLNTHHNEPDEHAHNAGSNGDGIDVVLIVRGNKVAIIRRQQTALNCRVVRVQTPRD